MGLMEYEAVIFDLDGTLVDSMWIWEEIDIEYLGRKNLTFPKDMQKEIEGMSFTETAHYFKNRFMLTDSIEEIKSEWRDMAYEFYENHIPLKNGVLEILEYLKTNQIKIAIGTSNNIDLATTVLKKHNILDYFESIRTSCEVPKGKPHPDIFLKVADDLEVEPGKCLVFEDTEAGALAANRAGMKVIVVEDINSEFPVEQRESLAENYINDFKVVI